MNKNFLPSQISDVHNSEISRRVCGVWMMEKFFINMTEKLVITKKIMMNIVMSDEIVNHHNSCLI